MADIFFLDSFNNRIRNDISVQILGNHNSQFFNKWDPTFNVKVGVVTSKRSYCMISSTAATVVSHSARMRAKIASPCERSDTNCA